MEDEKKTNEPEAVAGQPGPNPEELAQQEAAAKRKRKTWITVGIILLIVVGIPLILFGTCLLIFARP